MGQRLGKEKLFSYIRNFGFGSKTGIDLNGEASGILFNLDKVGPVELATTAFGQGVSVTPIQQLTSVSAAINGGNLYKPYVVKRILEPVTNNVIKENTPTLVRNVIDSNTSKEVRRALESVVANGTGRNAYIEGHSVGGKTGTAQKVVDGVYGDGLYISSFVGVAPTTDPKVVCLMTVDEPVGTYYASVIAAPTVGKMVEEIMKYMEIEPQYTEEELGKIEKETVVVPNVVGMTLKEASVIIENEGLNHNVTIDVDENMLVKDQFPQAGTKVKKHSIVTIVLE